MSDLREKAKEIVKDSQPSITHYEIPEKCIPYLVNCIHEALEAAYKQGAMARIEGPSEDERDAACEKRIKTFENAKHDFRFLRLMFLDGADWYKDNLKITSLSEDKPFECDFHDKDRIHASEMQAQEKAWVIKRSGFTEKQLKAVFKDEKI